MPSAAKSATQLTLIFINFLFVAIGATCMGVGGWILIFREDVKALTLIDAVTNDLGLLQNASILLIASGVVLFALGILGCFATYREQRCIRVIYIGMIVFCCAVSIAAIVVGFKFRDQVEEKLLTSLQSKLKTDYEGYTTSSMDFSQAFDYAQVDFECCGIQSYHDFNASATKWTVRESAIVPPTCCVLVDKDVYLKDTFIELVDKNCLLAPDSTNSHINKACHDPLKQWMEKQAVIIGGVAIAATVLQVIGIVLMAIILKQQPKSTDYLYRDTLGRH